MVSEPREKKKPNYFRFIHESILGNLLVTVFHSSHLLHLLKLSGQPYCRQKTLTPGEFFGDFSDEVLFRHWPYHQVRKEEIFKFCHSTGGRISVMHRPCAFLLRQPEPHVLAREGAWSTFWQCASTSSLAGCHLATLSLCLCHPSPASAFFWGFCLRRPSKQPFRPPLVTSSPPRALHVS